MNTQTHTPASNKWRIIGWGGALALLLTPLVAMQFTSEVNWTGSDFVAAIILLGGAGLAIEIALRLIANRRTRAIAIVAIIAALLLIWADGAVGIF